MFCVLDGKAYVGQTTQAFKTRRDAHYRNCVRSVKRRGRYFAKALLKHGKDNFVWTVLSFHSNQNELDKAEEYWVDFLNTLVPNGYNLKAGGGGRGKHSQALIEINRQLQLGKKRTLETIENNRAAQLIAQNKPEVVEKKRASMKGKNRRHLTEKEKEQRRQTMLKIWRDRKQQR